ncbi:hypothetical protein VNO78_21764 [Psophocarpus tetragonolobus]|uniref:Uncharacterized protein n=1 Tax=Psophocarpus tetragonolobus TaxID=3891 RepID=A0AAN9SBF8_PSOTE
MQLIQLVLLVPHLILSLIITALQPQLRIARYVMVMAETYSMRLESDVEPWRLLSEANHVKTIDEVYGEKWNGFLEVGSNGQVRDLTETVKGTVNVLAQDLDMVPTMVIPTQELSCNSALGKHEEYGSGRQALLGHILEEGFEGSTKSRKCQQQHNAFVLSEMETMSVGPKVTRGVSSELLTLFDLDNQVQVSNLGQRTRFEHVTRQSEYDLFQNERAIGCSGFVNEKELVDVSVEYVNQESIEEENLKQLAAGRGRKGGLGGAVKKSGSCW